MPPLIGLGTRRGFLPVAAIDGRYTACSRAGEQDPQWRHPPAAPAVGVQGLFTNRYRTATPAQDAAHRPGSSRTDRRPFLTDRSGYALFPFYRVGEPAASRHHDFGLKSAWASPSTRPAITYAFTTGGRHDTVSYTTNTTRSGAWLRLACTCRSHGGRRAPREQSFL